MEFTNPFSVDEEKVSESGSQDFKRMPAPDAPSATPAPQPAALAAVDAHPLVGEWYLPKNLWTILRYKSGSYLWKALTHGMMGEYI